jgi:methylmalonyl-CoA mutase N-terminal domain/subunit
MPAYTKAGGQGLGAWHLILSVDFVGRFSVSPSSSGVKQLRPRTAPESRYNRRVSSAIPAPPVRTPDDLRGWDPETELAYPGEYPFTRGIQPTMYRGRLWTMRQYAGFATAEESNARYRYLLAQGVSGLSVAFDLPTQMGYDSDHQLAAGEVGRVGVAIDSLEDMAALFDRISLDRVSTSMTINATAIILLSLYIAVARRQGVAVNALAGTVQNDILKEYVARGTYIYPPRASLRIVTDIFAYCEREMPNWNTISISGYHIREAGSTAVQEVAFTFAHAVAYVQAAIDAGLDVNQVGQRLSFFFNAHNDFLEEIAKFRAARRLWARIMRDRFHATHPRAQQLRFHTQTAGSTLTARQPDNNIVRVALQAMAAVLGGTQSLHCNGRDEALALPTEDSARIALRTQQIIASETGVANTVDPFAGSFAVEAMTNAIERGAEQILAKIEHAGGTLSAIEAGLIQRDIQESAYRAQMDIDTGAATVVGVNRFVADGQDAPMPTLTIDAAIERQQIERVRAVRASRSESAWRAALDEVNAAARGDQNLVPAIVAAVEAHATVGEIADTLRAVFGEYKETASL